VVVVGDSLAFKGEEPVDSSSLGADYQVDGEETRKSAIDCRQKLVAKDADGLFPRVSEPSPSEVSCQKDVVVAVGKGWHEPRLAFGQRVRMKPIARMLPIESIHGFVTAQARAKGNASGALKIVFQFSVVTSVDVADPIGN
jgi:hypothetical protein